MHIIDSYHSLFLNKIYIRNFIIIINKSTKTIFIFIELQKVRRRKKTLLQIVSTFTITTFINLPKV